MQLSRTVGELAAMSSLEYAHWLALANLEPIGPERGDWHAAQVVATLANVNRNAKEHPQPYRTRDFLLWAEPAEQTDEEVEQQLLALFPPSN